MNFPFLLSLKYGIETMCTGLRVMQENSTYITENDFLSKVNDPDSFFMDYCISTCRFQQAFLKNQEELLEKITEQIHNTCTHEWITDWIHKSPDDTKRIKYCKHCEITEH